MQWMRRSAAPSWIPRISRGFGLSRAQHAYQHGRHGFWACRPRQSRHSQFPRFPSAPVLEISRFDDTFFTHVRGGHPARRCPRCRPRPGCPVARTGCRHRSCATAPGTRCAPADPRSAQAAVRPEPHPDHVDRAAGRRHRGRPAGPTWSVESRGVRLAVVGARRHDPTWCSATVLSAGRSGWTGSGRSVRPSQRLTPPTRSSIWNRPWVACHSTGAASPWVCRKVRPPSIEVHHPYGSLSSVEHTRRGVDLLAVGHRTGVPQLPPVTEPPSVVAYSRTGQYRAGWTLVARGEQRVPLGDVDELDPTGGRTLGTATRAARVSATAAGRRRARPCGRGRGGFGDGRGGPGGRVAADVAD